VVCADLRDFCETSSGRVWRRIGKVVPFGRPSWMLEGADEFLDYLGG